MTHQIKLFKIINLLKQIFAYRKTGARRDDEKSFQSDIELWWILTDNDQWFPKC